MLSEQVATKKQQLAAKERKTEGLCTYVALPDFTPAGQRDLCNTKTRVWCKQQALSKGIKLRRCSARSGVWVAEQH